MKTIKVTIEEDIYDVRTRLPLRKVIFTKDKSKITRNLFILKDSERRNTKIDVIDFVSVDISTANKLSTLELGKLVKKELFDCFQRNINAELPGFKSPIITTEKVGS